MLVVVVDGDDDGLRHGLSVAQRLDHLDARAVGQTEVDERQFESLARDGGQRVADTGALKVVLTRS